MLHGEVENEESVWGIFYVTEGVYAGCEALNIKGLNNKYHLVSVKNPVQCMNNRNKYIIAFPEEPLSCMVHWVKNTRRSAALNQTIVFLRL